MTVRRAPTASAGSGSPALDLEETLAAWREQSDLAVAAIEASDFGTVERALGRREELRSGIAALVSLVGDSHSLDAGFLERLDRSVGDASAADQAILAALEGERGRLEQEIATVRREPTPSVAYRLPDTPVPHHLNIIR